LTPADNISTALHATADTAMMAAFLSLLLVVTNTCMETLLVELSGNDDEAAESNGQMPHERGRTGH
jgi:hypothetical protein